jgi:oligoribonuclease
MPCGVSRRSITVAAGLASTWSIAADGNALRSLLAVLVWMDLEMTGLDPARHVIVEIATLVTDDQLNIIAEGPDLVVHQDDAALAEMDEVVVEMHTKSGLLDAIRSSTISLADAGAQTLEFIKQHVTEARRVPLCGNSIGMDRRFLAAYLPEIEEYLHYRSVDVSTVKELVKRWYPALNSGRPRKAGSHRAMDDVIESISEMNFYREHVFVHEVPSAASAAAVVPDADFPEPAPTEHSPESS